MKSIRYLLGSVFCILLASCSPIPKDCGEVSKEILRKTFNSSGENGYYIATVKNVLDWSSIPNYPYYDQQGNPLTFKYGEKRFKSYQLDIKPNGEIVGYMFYYQCLFPTCSTQGNRLTDTNYNNGRQLYEKDQSLSYLTQYPPSISPTVAKGDVIQCPLDVITSNKQTGIFDVTFSTWNGWRVDPRQSGTIEFQIQSQ